MMPKPRENVSQRADYTQKYNAGNGRHGWLRLTPAYSVKVVGEILDRYSTPVSVLDPFCGTGTTALCAANRGDAATTIDINPFLAWFASTKTATYSLPTLETVERKARQAIDAMRSRAVKPVPCPPIHNIERWWTPDNLEQLCYLKAAVSDVFSGDSKAADLLHVAFCRTLILMSNARFNHQSMSFRSAEENQPSLLGDTGSTFLEDVRHVIDTAAQNPTGNSTVVQGDAKDPASVITGKYDAVITSPPYANRMSYIRELRPYMYWLGYLANGRDAGELDWSAIGGTWGVATSRLAEWSSCGNWWVPEELQDVISAISDTNGVNSKLLAAYVNKYFHDISQHFSGLRDVLSRGADVHYVIGNSSFYGVLVPTERFYADIMYNHGFHDITVNAIRKRNSKKELLEFIVSAKWLE